MMNHRRMRIVILTLGFTATSVALWAQAKPVKGAVVYLKVPFGTFESQTSFWGSANLSASIEPTGDGVSVNGEAGWRLSGFPPLTEFKVKKIKAKATSAGLPSGPAEIELEREAGRNLKLSFPKGEVPSLFSQILATEPELESYRQDTYRLLAAKFFDGTPLASLSDGQKQALCTFAHMTANGTTMGSVSYKDNLYLLINLGLNDSIYNDLRLNQAQRVAQVVNERLLTLLKAFSSPVKDTQEIYGLKLELLIAHRSFLDDSAIPSFDKLELYAPADLIRQFADADITSQQFIDGCVVIVEGNRVSVPLAGS